MSIFSLKGIFGDKDARFIKSLNPIISKINSHETEFKLLKDEDFPKKTLELKERLSAGATLDDVLPEAFALVREASLRTLSQRHYDVQMIGGIVLHQGKIAEMRTGEGKTLVATLPAYLNALAGKGVHVVTTNDYLSRRDAAWMGQVYSFLGLSVSVINSLNTSYLYDPTHTDSDKERDEEGSFKVVYEFLKPCSRRQAYAADITYGTNNEYGFDYLRDNLAGSVGDLMQRGHFFALVDEVDSILIDESRTPLIISSQTEESEDLYVTFSNIAKKLIKDEDFTIDEKLKSISLSETGITKAERILGVENIYTEKGIKYVHHLETAVKAEALYTKDKDYVVSADEVIIVDPFTGRMQPGRRWSEGLHQAIEAKENVKIQRETRAVASITFQNYFRFYDTLAGMTGTAQTSAEEFHKVYGLDVVSIPTHRAINRTDRNDLIFQSERGKFQAIAKKIKELQDKGQPVLVGTVSIEKSELLSAYLLQESVKHTVLNAKNHEREGELIAQAGRKGSVMIATNMAGRGVDIMLGGNPSTSEEQEEIKKLGGLLVLGTERHEARRIDNQLRGRSGRQGDPGETQFYVSMEDDLMRIFGSSGIKSMMGKIGIPEDQPIENSLITRALESAQAKIEGFHFDARKNTLEYDDVMNHQRKVVYERRRNILIGDQAFLQQFTNEIIEGSDVADKIEEKKNALGPEGFYSTARRIALYTIDTLWVDHLETMEYMRQSVNLRAYGQREPLVEYKKDGLRMFKEMEQSFKGQVLNLLATINVAPAEKAEKIIEIKPQENYTTNKEEISAPLGPEGDKIGRNDLCPCGSGKKYKKCHGA